MFCIAFDFSNRRQYIGKTIVGAEFLVEKLWEVHPWEIVYHISAHICFWRLLKPTVRECPPGSVFLIKIITPSTIIISIRNMWCIGVSRVCTQSCYRLLAFNLPCHAYIHDNHSLVIFCLTVFSTCVGYFVCHPIHLVCILCVGFVDRRCRVTLSCIHCKILMNIA